jgi:hypothetical protein
MTATPDPKRVREEEAARLDLIAHEAEAVGATHLAAWLATSRARALEVAVRVRLEPPQEDRRSPFVYTMR